MGWDAYALKSAEAYESGEDRLDPVLCIIFWEANAELVRQTGSGGQLIDGTLGSTNLPFLIRATPVVCFDLDIEEGMLLWSASTVKEANDRAQWDYAVDDWFNDFLGLPSGFIQDDSWMHEYHRCQTRLFLKTCAEHNFVIWFSW